MDITKPIVATTAETAKQASKDVLCSLTVSTMRNLAIAALSESMGTDMAQAVVDNVLSDSAMESYIAKRPYIRSVDGRVARTFVDSVLASHASSPSLSESHRVREVLAAAVQHREQHKINTDQ